MTEPITSKFTLFYKVKTPAAIVLGCFFAYLLFSAYPQGTSPENETASNRMIFFIIIIALIINGAIGIWFIPRKMTISIDGILLHENTFKKQENLLYQDIDKVRIVETTQWYRGVIGINNRILELVLNKGKKISIDENSYENWSSLKAAIYDHKYRGL